MQLSQSGQPAVILLRPDVFPHDEEDGGTDEAELDGAGEEEGAAALVQVVHHLQAETTGFPGLRERTYHLSLRAGTTERNVAHINGVPIAHSHKVSLTITLSVASILAKLHQQTKHVLTLQD